MTMRLQIATAVLFAASALFVACGDTNQAPTDNVVGEGGTGGQTSSGGNGNFAGATLAGGTDAAAGVGTGTGASAGSPSGTTGGTAGNASTSAVLGTAGAAPCVLSDKGCYDCKQLTLPQQFLNQCPIAGVTCEPFNNSRVPK